MCENNCCTTFVWFAFTLYFFNSMCYQTKLIEYCFICSISEKCLTVFLFFCLTVFGKSNSKTSVWSNKISVWKRRKKCLIRQKNKKTRSVNGPLVFIDFSFYNFLCFTLFSKNFFCLYLPKIRSVNPFLIPCRVANSES